MAEPGETRLHGLDHLRVLAITLVLLLHYRFRQELPEPLAAPGISQFVWFGWSGVDLFFVLSGYLIGDRLLAEMDRTGSIRLSRFWLGRALRILPAYLAVLAVYFGYYSINEDGHLAPLWRYLTFTHNLPPGDPTHSFAQAWSLGVEWHFYLLLPVLLLLLSRAGSLPRLGWALLAVVAFCLVARYLAWSELVDPLVGRARRTALSVQIYLPTYTRLDGVAVGVAIAALFRYRPALRDRITAHGNALLAVGLLALILCCRMYGGVFDSSRALHSGPISVLGLTLVALAYGVIVIGALSPGSVLHRWRSPVTARLAAWSYAIYLVHMIAFRLGGQILAPKLGLTAIGTFLTCFALAVGLGAFLHYAVERPFLEFRGRLLARAARPPAMPDRAAS